MPRSSVLAAVLAVAVSSSAFAEAQLPGYDAFIASQSDRPVRLDALPADVKARVDSGRISSTEKRLGVPTFFWAVREPGLKSLKISPEQAARRFLFAYAELYRSTPAALAEARLQGLHDTGFGPIVATFQKDVKGVRVFNDEIKVVMNADLQLIAITGYLTPARRVKGEFDLANTTAIGAAYEQLTGRPLDGQLGMLPRDAAGFDRYQLAGQGTPARARKVYFPMPDGLVPAYHVELELSAEGSTESDYYAFVISAKDGTLLFRKNLTAKDFDYRVWADSTGLKMPFDGPNGNDPTPHPQATNNQYNPPFVLPNLVSLNAGPISTNDPWLDPAATTTDGNNTSAYADLAGPNGFSNGDLKATTTGDHAFDRVYDTAQSPNISPDQRMAAVTQLFYNVNFFHDWYYDVGFKEADGNAQTNNFGRGGAGNDAIYAEAEDYSGTSNANMSTPSDGAHPRMQMYVFTAGTPASLTLSPALATPITRVGVADFGPTSFSVTGELVLVNDGDTVNMSTVTDGCTATGWVTNVAGKIAVIDRGLCTFAEKVQNAQTNGAIGALILNNAQGGAIPLSGSSATVMIPSLSTGRTDGTNLKARLAMGTTTTATLTRANVLNRDGTIDNAIVAHEWGHYISNRIIGDGNGISNNQAVGMGEGWADFHSMLMVVKEEDGLVASNANFNGTYGLAAYTTMATDPNGMYWGIRRVPYSTDMMKNPLTFKHIQNNVALPTGIPVAFGQSGRDNAEYHNTGEVWATMLWECYAALLRDTGRLTFDQARDRMRAYLVASYKITPLVPTFVDARDAVLASAVAADPTDFALFSAAFAKRGLGMNAIAPDKDSQTNSPVTESFANGNAFQIVKVELDDSVMGCDHDGKLDASETGKLTITLKNVGIGVLANTTGTVVTTAAGVTIANGGALTFAPIAPFTTGVATLNVSVGNVPGNAGANFDISLNDPSLATPGPVRLTQQFRLNYDAKPSGSIIDDVEAPMPVWVFANNPNGATGSDFRRYEDSATAHWFFGPNPDSPADTYLISPSLVVGTGPFSFSFSHRFQFEGDAMEYFDGGVIEISTNNGQTWADLGAMLSQPYTGMIDAQSNNPLRGRSVYSGQSANYPAFSTVTADLGTAYAGRSVRIRFRIGSDDALGLKGWEIDNLAFVGITNRPFPSVVTDPNTCTNGAPTVVAPAPREVPEGTVVKLTVVASDPDNEPVTLTFTQVSGPLVTMTGDTFTAPEVDADVELGFEVVATDGRAVSAPVTQKITVKNVNKKAVSVITPETQTVDEGTAVTLTGSATDGDGQTITGYRWVQTAGPTATLSGADTTTLTFTAPEVTGDQTLSFQLFANDGVEEGDPAIATVTVHDTTVPPKPVDPPKSCGCSSGSEGFTAWLAAALALMMVLAKKRQR